MSTESSDDMVKFGRIAATMQMRIAQLESQLSEAREREGRLRMALQVIADEKPPFNQMNGFSIGLQMTARAALTETPERAGETQRQGAVDLSAVSALLDAMETCHVCSGLLALDDFEPTHCENCSGDCDAHDEPDCTPIHVLHANARRAVRAASIPAAQPQGERTDTERLDWLFGKWNGYSMAGDPIWFAMRTGMVLAQVRQYIDEEMARASQDEGVR